MKRISILFLLLFVLVKFYGQDTIFTSCWGPFPNGRFFDLNDRDTTNKYFYIDSTQSGNIWKLGTPTKAVFDSAYTPPLALVTDTVNTYPNNNTSSFSFIVWTNCNWSAVYFMHRFDTDTLSDGCVIEYSTDGGTTWNNIINSTYSIWSWSLYSNADTIASNSNKPGFSGTSGWTGVAMEGFTIDTVVEYRFTFTSDSVNTNKDGWMIDNIIIQNSWYSDINEIKDNQKIQIFPNPTSNFISIQTENNIKFKSAEIKDVLGKTILTSNNTTIDLSKFEPGIYFVELTTDKGKYVKRIIRN